MPPRVRLLTLAAALIAAGLALRLGRWNLPLAVHHSGGGLMWGGMVYALVAAARPGRWRVPACLAASMAAIAAVEGSRLLHGPGLDAFRGTLAGQLLLGRIFSAWNVAVDGAGAALVAAATLPLVAVPRPRRDRRAPRHGGR